MRIYTPGMGDALTNVETYVWCPISGVVGIDGHECPEAHRSLFAYVAPGNEL